MQPSAEDDKELQELYKDVEPSLQVPFAPEKPHPVIRTGDSIVCQWTTQSAEYFFGAASQRWNHKTAVSVARTEEKKQKSELTLDSCLSEFSRQEKLDADNTWYCPTCKEFKEATKQVDLWSLPDILVIHLKRFSAGRMSRDKISDLVDFPLEGLDLSNRTVYKELAERLMTTSEGKELLQTDQTSDEPMLYDLFAVDNHFGGLGGGHYTAYAKNSEDGIWYNFDDSSASAVTNPEKTVKSSAAYLLFYRRRSNREFGGKTVEIVNQSRATSAQQSEHGDNDEDQTLQIDQQADDYLPSANVPAIGSMNLFAKRRDSADSNEAQGTS